ncbi:hypothetical protein WAI453_003786 [Rhynchosporium graminicola]
MVSDQVEEVIITITPESDVNRSARKKVPKSEQMVFMSQRSASRCKAEEREVII